MKKTSSFFLAAALSCIAMSAAAGGSHGSQGSNGAAGGGGGGGGGGGSGIGVGIAAASTRTEIGIANTVGFGLTTGATTANGGLGFGGAATGIGGAGGSIGSGAVQVTAGNSTYRAAASSAFAPGAHGPVESCRLFMGAGASGVKGSLSGGLPIGNDQACVIEASHRIMNRMNAMKPDSFSYDDYLRPVCKFEGMSETAECKALVEHETAAAPVGMAYTPN